MIRGSAARILKLTILAIAFGYIEGAVAHYLRLHYYPEGFAFPLKTMEERTVIIEMGRELATLIVLASAAMIGPGGAPWKAASFVYMFAVWDISYYGVLKLFEGWPGSLLDPDVLFLIPVPWVAPVLAPLIISMSGIAGSFTVFYLYGHRERPVRIGYPAAILISISLIAWLATFIPVSGPYHYNWYLFSAGSIFAAAGLFAVLFRNPAD